MERVAEYRRRAARAQEEASLSNDPDAQRLFLQMAADWLALAAYREGLYHEGRSFVVPQELGIEDDLGGSKPESAAPSESSARNQSQRRAVRE